MTNKYKMGLMAVAMIPLCALAAQNVAADDTYLVRQDCLDTAACYETIQGALEAIAANPKESWSHVKIAAGDYYEKVTVRSGKVRLGGEGQQSTRLHFDAVAKDAGKYHRDGWGTPGSATLTVDADQVTVENITIENTFDYLANDILPNDDPKKIPDSQGVALLLDVHSDRVFFNNVSLIAYQDTLFANGRRAYLKNSFIAGNVDFIFGNGQLLIEDSTVESRRRGRTFPAHEIQSFIAAPSTQLSQRLGIVIHRSRLTREEGLPDQSVTLARPWHPTTTFADGRYADPNAVGQASYIDCFMDAHIHEQHWSSMNGTARDGSKTDVFKPQDSRFHETGSYGPGARHVDIGIKWKDAPGIEEVYQIMFADWPGFAGQALH
jgi:pectinesterase